MNKYAGEYVQVPSAEVGPAIGEHLDLKLLASKALPEHVALIMDGNGRWANSRGLPRVAGHQAGEVSLIEVAAGALAAGVKFLSVYAFSTENWRRSPAEVRFLMGYSREVIRRRAQLLGSWGVRIHWSGAPGRLWKSVISQLRDAEQVTAGGQRMHLALCVNYGGRAELTQAARSLAQEAADGTLNPARISEKTLANRLYLPQFPDVDLMIRTSGEQRTSNFLPWQAAYAELIFAPEPWPEYDRVCLWRDLGEYARRQRRFGTATDTLSQ